MSVLSRADNRRRAAALIRYDDSLFFSFLIVNDDLFVVPTVCIIRYLGLNVVVCIVIDDTLDPWNA